jgi:hypothetical protein
MHLLEAVNPEFSAEVREVGFELNKGDGELPVLPHWLFKWKGEEGRREDVVERSGGVMRGVVEEEGGGGREF